MKVLVTGGCGYIGSHIVLELLDHNHEVAVVDNMSTPSILPWPTKPYEGLDVPAVSDMMTCDYTHPAVERLLRWCDVVIHTAALSIVGDSVDHPLEYWQKNVADFVKFLEMCDRCDVGMFIQSSTAAVYGTSPTHEPLLESYAGRFPIENPYGQTKLACEQILEAYAQTRVDFRHVSLRYFNVAGADPYGRSGQSTRNATHLITVAARVAASEDPRPMEIYGANYPTPDGTCIRDYIHVSDLARAHVLAAHFLRDRLTALEYPVALNIGTAAPSSVREVLATMRTVVGDSFPLPIEKPPRRGDPPYLVADPSLAIKMLGFRPRRNLEQMCRHAFVWESSPRDEIPTAFPFR